MEVKSVQKFIRMSPRKLRLVVSLIKHMSPNEAIEILPYIRKRAAEPLGKVIKTAVANAREKQISEETLVFKEIQITQGPSLKRWRAGARGRAKPYKKRTSHIRVVLETRNIKKKEKVSSKNNGDRKMDAITKKELQKDLPRKQKKEMDKKTKVKVGRKGK